MRVYSGQYVVSESQQKYCKVLILQEVMSFDDLSASVAVYVQSSSYGVQDEI